MATRRQLEQQYIEDRAFWGSIASRWRGLASGLILGGLLGAVVGVIAAGTLAAATGLSMAAMSPTALAGVIGAFTVGGIFFGANVQGSAGQVSGAVAAGLMAQKELEAGKNLALEQEVKLSASRLSLPDKKPLVNWKVAGLGILVSGGLGALLGGLGAVPSNATYLLFGQQTGTAMGAVASGISLGTLGMIFGVNFKPWQAFKKWTDGMFEGRLTGRVAPVAPELKAQLFAQRPELVTAAVEPEAQPQAVFQDRLLLERNRSITLAPRSSTF